MAIRQERPDPRWLLAAAVVLAAVAISAQTGSGGRNRPEHLDAPYVVLVSMDGFRPDYLERFTLPNLQRVMQRGTRAQSMVPVFPTLTFPNHYSLVTGLHPGRHGIVANSFYDPQRRQKYSMYDTGAVRDGTWYGGEPIWVTAETQGMVAACFFWPGSEAAIKGVRPTITKRYDGNVSNRARVNTVLDWLKRPAEMRPHMITLYFSEVDDASHAGPLDSRDVERAAQSVDRAIGQLLDGIDRLPDNLEDRVYLLITSDHGMVDTSLKQSLVIESIADLDGVVHTFDGPVTSFHVNGDRARATKLRDQINARVQHGRAYLRDELPDRVHYDHPRAGDVIVIMDEGWTLRRRHDVRPYVRRRWGTHGWDANVPSMRATFLAMGPRIRKGATVDEVHNVDVYPLMAELLGLRPADGIDGRAREIARKIME